MATDKTEKLIMNHYPNDILEPHNNNRSVRILVKEQQSLGGGVDELKKKIEQAAKDVGEVYTKITSGATPETEQKEIEKRVAKLVNAKTIWGIALPLPNELTDSQSHQWESSEGAVGTVLGGMMNKDIMGVSVSSGIGELSSSAGFRKPLVDPGYFQDYKGTGPREFTFSWEFVPNNKDEAVHIKDIIYNLKKFTLPKSTINGMSLLSPYIFDIELGNVYISSLMNMNNVVCTNMSINYSADNSLQFFSDGTPKYITLSMTFAERATVTADFY